MKLLLSLLTVLSLGITDMVVLSQPTTNAQMGHIRHGVYILELPDALEEVPDIPEVVAFLLEGDGRVLYHFNATFVGAVVAGIKYNTTMARLRASPLIRQIIPVRTYVPHISCCCCCQDGEGERQRQSVVRVFSMTMLLGFQ